jgi:hypothetical protein
MKKYIQPFGNFFKLVAPMEKGTKWQLQPSSPRRKFTWEKGISGSLNQVPHNNFFEKKGTFWGRKGLNGYFNQVPPGTTSLNIPSLLLFLGQLAWGCHLVPFSPRKLFFGAINLKIQNCLRVIFLVIHFVYEKDNWKKDWTQTFGLKGGF